MKKLFELGNLMPHLPAKVRDGVHRACKEEGVETDNAFVERAVHAEKALVNQLDPGSRAAVKYVSVRTCDQEGDLVVPKGIVLTEFMKNPVFFWGHNYSLPPLGSDEMVDVDDTGLKVKSIYGDTGPGTMADIVWKLVQQGHQKQSSIGYVPLHSTKRNDNGFQGELDVFQKSWPELKDSRSNVKRILHKVLMLEHSDVGLGMNRDTTVLQAAKDFGATDVLFKQMGVVIDLTPPDPETKADAATTDEAPDKEADDEDEAEAAMCQCPECGRRTKLVGKACSAMACPKCQAKMADAKEADEAKPKDEARGTPAPFAKHGRAPVAFEWKALREATAAEPDELEQMAGFQTFGDPEMKSTYLFIHHRAMDLRCVWKGLREAMGTLLGARGGVALDAAHKRAVYQHLAKHYHTEFDQEPPELREYTQGELREMFPELYESKGYVRKLHVAEVVVRPACPAFVREVKSMESMVKEALELRMGRV